jgi:steroid delta-isomerase-like uncharacterized protein
MRIMLARIILILFFSSAAWAQDQAAKPDTASTSPAPASQPADTLPRKYVDLWNTGDFDSMKPFFSPFYMTSHGPRVAVNEAMLRKVITFWRQSMPDLNFKIKDTIIQGDKVAMRLTFTGTYKAQLFPFTVPPKATDPPKTIRGSEMLFFQLKDGKIVEIWEQYDEMVMRVQMGGVWSEPTESTAKPAPKPAPPAAKP